MALFLVDTCSFYSEHCACLDFWEIVYGTYEYLLAANRSIPVPDFKFPQHLHLDKNDFYEPVRMVGVALTATLTLGAGWWLSRKQFPFSYESWIRLAFLSAIIVPFILPGMHERYMYLGDVLGVLYYLVFRKNIHLPLGILLVSTYSYIRCSRYKDVLPMEPAFFVYLLTIIFTSIYFVTGLKREINEN